MGYIITANQIKQDETLSSGTRLILGVENVQDWHRAQPQPAPGITQAELNEALQVFGKNLKSDLIEQLSQRDKQRGRSDRWWYLGGTGIIGLLLGVLGLKAAGRLVRSRFPGSAGRGKNMVDIFPGIKVDSDGNYYRDNGARVHIEDLEGYEGTIKTLQERKDSHDWYEKGTGPRPLNPKLVSVADDLIGFGQHLLALAQKLTEPDADSDG